MNKGLSRSVLKYWAIFAMLIDHIAWMWFPDTELPGQLMHLIGRTTAPIMCFFIAEGYKYSKSLNRYLLRLIIFTAISYFPFVLFSDGFFKLPVIWTLMFGLLAIQAWDQIDNPFLRILAIIAICALGSVGDWTVFGVLMCLSFWIFRDSRIKQTIALAGIAIIELIFFAILAFSIPPLPHSFPQLLQFIQTCALSFLKTFERNWYQLGIVIAMAFLFAYNGEKGKHDPKWMFYIFYPAHLLVLVALKTWVFTV
ncbi:MAG: conjugal transfer protein TraX [Oscillospiraceae bacterium]|jgi:hypothetical protein|nr:conjugal transfer protein TraX [Oscillospiraceae bacterium]